MLPSHMLPSHMLPSYVLPSRALQIIHDFSKPVTRPDWRQSKPIITTYQMYLKLKYLIDIDCTGENLLHYRLLCRIIKTEWYYAYTYILKYGLTSFKKSCISKHILKMDGIDDAECQHYITNDRYIEYD
jgi:hypothetical protein